jgi:EH domain-containing protein 1
MEFPCFYCVFLTKNAHINRYDGNRRLFEDEEQDLFRDLQSLPRNAALRKLNDLIKRARLAKVHAYIIAELRKDMPSVFGKEGKKKDLIKNLGAVYDRLQKEHQISPGDFPDIKKMQDVLQNQDFAKFHSLKPHLIEAVDRMLATDISRLMSMIPQEESQMVSEPTIKGKSHSRTNQSLAVKIHVTKSLGDNYHFEVLSPILHNAP